MRSTTLPVRKGFYLAIQPGLMYQNKAIPVYEEYMPASAKPAQITFNNQTVGVYVILLNQTSNHDPILKCFRNDQSSIQVQVTTVYPSGTGGSELAELIGDTIKVGLFQSGNNNSSVQLDPPFNMWKCNYESARNIPYDTDTNRVWVHQMTFLCYVSQ